MELAEMSDDELADVYLSHIGKVRDATTTDQKRQWGERFEAIREEKSRRFEKRVILPRRRGEVTRPDWCVCHDSYWLRGRDDPGCRHDVIEELHETIELYRQALRQVAPHAVELIERGEQV